MDESEIEVDQRKARLDLRGAFVMKARQREFARVKIEIAQIVVSFNVSRLVLE